MARVTVEDCILKIPNRFELVMLAARRARDMSSGAPLTVDRDNDKNPVIALREIADGTISLEDIWENMIQNLQHHMETEEPEEEVAELGVNLEADLSVGSPMGGAMEDVEEAEEPSVKPVSVASGESQSAPEEDLPSPDAEAPLSSAD